MFYLTNQALPLCLLPNEKPNTIISQCPFVLRCPSHARASANTVYPDVLASMTPEGVAVIDASSLGNNTNFVASIIKQLGDRFFLKDMGLLHCLLGVEVSLKLLDGTTNVDNTEFRRIIGSLQYLSLKRPDISFAVNKLSQFMHKPTTIHFTTKKGFFGTQSKPSSMVGNIDDRTSTSAYISFLGSNPISWSSKKQRAVARSTTEAEYRALANVTFETMWFLGLLHELDFSLKAVSLLLCDNLGATHLSFNLVQHSRMKHIQIDLHFVCDLVQRGSLQVRQVHTQDQLADLLIKPLSRQRTELLRHKIRLADGSSILRGRIKTKTDCKDQGND
ncbi:Retrovirus-related Pol polyprotein from transposon RE1 [Vitis vinifera]|uniref:Retrovirus-related Pol polyprotein from transposon RE1 n=1 Tax=Vitis vinifera TaxID=29760 RepID=A0A438JA83_VITVI|nr:Retrovirus-related Pol polyprotein from transposon RE1 [Vitis vinifera]